MKYAAIFCLAVVEIVMSAPSLRVVPDQLPAQLLTLPGNATSIRANIDASFNCEGRDYGYYADVDNDCQLFHVCLPVTYASGRSQTFRWSFICPEETVFNQEMFTCTRSDESIDCYDSPRFYDLNRNLSEDSYHSAVTAASVLDGPSLDMAPPHVPSRPQYQHHHHHLEGEIMDEAHHQIQADEATRVPDVAQALDILESVVAGEHRESKPILHSRRFSKLH